MSALGPCAKTVVEAVLIARDGGPRFTARNDVRRPQRECPRGPNSVRDLYTDCKLICDQPYHAEEAVLRLAGAWAVGATVWVSHHRVCWRCEDLLEKAGVREVRLGRPPA